MILHSESQLSNKNPKFVNSVVREWASYFTEWFGGSPGQVSRARTGSKCLERMFLFCQVGEKYVR